MNPKESIKLHSENWRNASIGVSCTKFMFERQLIQPSDAEILNCAEIRWIGFRSKVRLKVERRHSTFGTPVRFLVSNRSGGRHKTPPRDDGQATVE